VSFGASPDNPDPSHSIHLYITKNKPSSYVAYGWLDRATDHWVQTSASAVLHLVEGDRIEMSVLQNVEGDQYLAVCVNCGIDSNLHVNVNIPGIVLN
jgi:hypothetical protein